MKKKVFLVFAMAGCAALHAEKVYTSSVSDGGVKVFSRLEWDSPLPAEFSREDRIVINVDADAELSLDMPLDVREFRMNVAGGKTLVLAGGEIAAREIFIGGGTLATRGFTPLKGTLKGDGTVVYGPEKGSAPVEFSGGVFHDNVIMNDKDWKGVVWLRNIYLLDSLLPALAAGADSTLRLTGRWGTVNAAGDVQICPGTLELVDDGDAPAITLDNGYADGVSQFARLKGNGTFCSSATVVQRYVFRDVSGFFGKIDIPIGASTRVVLGEGALPDESYGTIAVVPGANVAVAPGKVWTATGGIVVDGTLELGEGARIPAVLSGTGLVKVASGTAKTEGYGARAKISVSVAQGATLGVEDESLRSMTLAAVDNKGTIDLSKTGVSETAFKVAAGIASSAGRVLYR